MGTEVLSRPGDYLKGNRFYNNAFSVPKQTQSRRKTASNRSPPTKPKKLNRKSSSPPPSASPLPEGFRLLKRGEQLTPVKPSDRNVSELVTPVQNKSRQLLSDPVLSDEKRSLLGSFKIESEVATPVDTKSGRLGTDPLVSSAQSSPIKSEQVFSSPPRKVATPVEAKSGRLGTDPVVSSVQSSPIKSKQDFSSPPPSKVIHRSQPGLVKAEQGFTTPPSKVASGFVPFTTYAGTAFTASSPEPSSLPFPKFVRKSNSMSSVIEDAASQTLKHMLKINFL